MKLYLNRQILLDDQVDGLVQVITETRRWSKGWLARLEAGKRRWIQHSDARLSRAGFGERIFTLIEPGNYEAESVCASLREHRVRFDVLVGGIIVLRRSTSPYRCGHLRWLDNMQLLEERINGADSLTMIASITSNDEPWKAALLIGGMLERHLRRMCEDRGLDTGESNHSKGIEALSAALKKSGVYPTEQHKIVLELAHLRKRAQHQGEPISQNEIEDARIHLQRFLSVFPASISLAQPKHLITFVDETENFDASEHT
jgi:hypothetical protein